ncbi:MAG: 1-acyl-sn-glycerol-3-phosphate acyltransferase, partial [Cyanobacteria bacterium J06635_11]
IFPEGGCSYQNDTIMPFRPGAIQLPMSVLAQQAKKATSPEQIPDFYIVPVSLKYRYQSPMKRIIEDTLTRLETELGLPIAAGDDYQRLRQVAHEVILRIEREAAREGLEDNVAEGPAESMGWNERIDQLRQTFIQRCEAALHIEPNLNMPIRERVYKVQAVLEEISAEDSQVAGATQTDTDKAIGENEQQPEQQSTDTLSVDREAMYWDTVRLLNFDAIYDGYVAESPTPERFLDTLTRLEREVFHLEHPQPKAPRKACFYIGEPISLKAYLADYQRDRSGTIDQLCEDLRETLQSNLQKT